MDFDLQRVKNYDIRSQLLVCGYGRENCDDLPETVEWITLAYYHEEAKFDEFDPNFYSVDSTSSTITKKGDENNHGCYVGIPMLCDGVNREIHEFGLKVVKGTYLKFGINEGRTNTRRNIEGNDTEYNYYVLNHHGNFHHKELNWTGEDWTSTNMKWWEGDTVLVKVDCGKRKISFRRDFWESWDHGDVDIAISTTPYYLVVALYEVGTKVSLVSHKVTVPPMTSMESDRIRLYQLMGIELQRVKNNHPMIQLLVFGYGHMICGGDLPELVLWMTLFYYHDEAKFDKFDPKSYQADLASYGFRSKRAIMKTRKNYYGCYVGIPMLCDGINREIHEFELRWGKQICMGRDLKIGIEEGRANTMKDPIESDSNYYLMGNHGTFYTKGKKTIKTDIYFDWAKNDRLSVKVDCKEKKIFYSVMNGKFKYDYGKIATSKEPYYLLLRLVDVADQVYLENYKVWV